MTQARIANRTVAGSAVYELINFTDDGEHVLRDEHGDITTIESSEVEWVELRCERCGHFARHVGPADFATCFDSNSPAACAEAAELRFMGSVEPKGDG